MIIGILLIFIALCVFVNSTLSAKKRSKKRPKAYNYENYYQFISDLDDWNDEIYAEYLRDCEKKGRIPVDKEIVNRDLEIKKNEIKNLFTD